MSVAVADPAPSLRDGVVRLLGETDPDVRGLEAFLAADAPEVAAELWFGRQDLARIGTVDQLRRMIDRDICEIDEVLSNACNLVLHHPRFTALEAAWRGVYWLAGAISADGQIWLRLLDVRWSELARDMERADEFDQSALFDKVYNQEFGMPGGVPFALLVGLYEVQHRPTRGHPTDDVTVLRQVCAVAAAAFAPFVVGAAPAMLGVDTLAELDRRPAMAAVFRGVEYHRFNAFRELTDARFVGIVCPRVLLRAPYRGRVLGDCGFAFTEAVADEGQAQVWGVGSLALAQICIRAFNDYRWLAAVRGTVEDTLAGGVLTDLAAADFETDAPGVMVKFPLEVNVTEHVERDLTEAGLICIRRCKDTPYTVVNNLPSANRPKGAYTEEAARINEQLSSMLNYTLCVSRFAHYVKVMARDWIGSFISPEDCQRRLNTWLLGYCAAGDDLSYEMRARYPLEAARVKVSTIPTQPGSFECQIYLKPHLQLDQAISEFQLITVVQGVQRLL